MGYPHHSAISCCSCPLEYPPGEGAFLIKEPCSRQLWLTEDVEPGELLNYTINTGANEVPATFAMMALLNYEPFPINVNGSDLVIFDNFELGKR